VKGEKCKPKPHLQKRPIQKHIFYSKVQYSQICHTQTGIYNIHKSRKEKKQNI